MKILKYFLISFFVMGALKGQGIKKDGKVVTAFTQEQAL